MKIVVAGTGYVGLVTGACFAETGNEVTCVDIDAKKVDSLRRGEIFFYEPSLAEMVRRNSEEGRLTFTTDLPAALPSAALMFICVGTPSRPDGSADLSHVWAVADTIAGAAPDTLVTVLKSTVPVGTADELAARFHKKGKGGLRIVSNPEFLREGSAVSDCMQPDRIVLGLPDLSLEDLFRDLYAPYVRTGHPIFVMDNRSAEMTKYAANGLLAARISFMNEIAQICEKTGGDVTRVREALGADHRIGQQYLFPSVGFGGSCFPKDVRALVHLSEANGLDPAILKATLRINDLQKEAFVRRVIEHFGGPSGAKGKYVAIWGLAFKAKTDDIRESPALTVIDGLLAAAMKVSVYDPAAMPRVQELYGDKLTYGKSAYKTLEGASALCVLTEWNQFRHPDFAVVKSLLKDPVIFDGRNLYEPRMLKKLGFQYVSIGR